MSLTCRHEYARGVMALGALSAALVTLATCSPMPSGMNNDNAANDNTAGNDNVAPGAEPVFPENYRESFTEVRNCRFSVEHGGFTIRVLANDVALTAYLNNASTLPVGSILVKEEFGSPDCTDDATLQQWRVMRKEAPGFDPNAGDWHWQRVLVNNRQVVEDDKASCISCHSVPECFDRDYMCTLP